MNDPSKVISVNLSSLLSLKAELLRKQTEVNKAKVAKDAKSCSADREYCGNKQKNKVIDGYDGITSLKKNDKKKHDKEIVKSKNTSIYEHEDSVLLEKSQRVLEAKAKFYERMQKSGGKLNSDDNCLVMFNKKKQEENTNNDWQKNCSVNNSGSSSEDDDDSDHPDDPEDEWVEYTDCLGRTRTCLKRDLAKAKIKDDQLAASMPERLDQTKANWMIDTVDSHNKSLNEGNTGDKDMIGPIPPPSIFGDVVSTMSKLEEQKANWERKEQENLDKKDVHYQDVFFDEARQHGVGYYAFSTDEEERRKQQRDLEKAREQTLEEQKRREVLKEQREKIIAERVFAAKNRQRARLGLLPLEKEEEANKKEITEEKHTETKEERKSRKKAEKLAKKKLKEEQEREKERLNHVRPWDKEKEGLISRNLSNEVNSNEEWQYKPEREPMTQEQWNEYKRNERINEFAPPTKFTDKPLKRQNFESTTNAYPGPNYDNVPTFELETRFSKYQSTKDTKRFKRRNCDDFAQEKKDDLATITPNDRNGVCIPPPTNLEDFHFNNKKSKTAHELEKSIEAGLRFLRNNCDKEMPGTKSSWTAKADY